MHFGAMTKQNPATSLQITLIAYCMGYPLKTSMSIFRWSDMSEKIKILIACEESDEVRGRFELMGFDAWSCDIQPNRNPAAKHYQCDIFEVINMGWDAMIAFPPCTHLAVSGAPHFEKKRADGRQQQAIDFFIRIASSPIQHIAVENPIGIMSNIYRKPDQIIQPYYFGDNVKKTTCLWLKNLPLLYHNASVNLFDQSITHVQPHFIRYKSKRTKSGFANYSGAAAKWFKSAEERSRERSKTFQGIATAMAEQWGEYIINQHKKTTSCNKHSN